MMIAWKLITDFDKQRHLFFKKIETDYILETYICSCGHRDFIIKYPEQKLDYICKSCENTKFYDANSAWRNIENFQHQNLDLEFLYEYDMQNNDDAINSLYIINIPQSIDFSSRKVIYTKKSVYSLTLGIDGELKENYSLRFDEKISFQLKKNLTSYLNQNSCFHIPDSKNKELTLTIASFFLKNKYLRDFDFYYWDDIDNLDSSEIYLDTALNKVSNFREEKSIQVALYKNYLAQLDKYGKFNSLFIRAFTQVINDVNIIVSFLKLDFEYSFSRDTINSTNLYYFINFLKRDYTEKQILRLFTKDDFNTGIGRDMISEFSYDMGIIEIKFRKVPCKVEALHDEFVRCSKEERYRYMQNQKLSYSKAEMKPCIETNSYQVKLPKTGKELFDWADALQNCMAGYFDMIKNHGTTIYAFFQEDVLLFAVEICDNEVIQASGKYNADLTLRENEMLTKWFELFFQKETQRLDNVA